VNTLYAALAFLAFVILLAVLSTKETNVTVSQKLTDLSASIANVTALVKSQSDQIAALKVQIDANQAVQAQADADVASLQAQIDALNALTVPPAPPAQ
jgi:peptidoglycan hydrolase CwlO-like protein